MRLYGRKSGSEGQQKRPGNFMELGIGTVQHCATILLKNTGPRCGVPQNGGLTSSLSLTAAAAVGTVEFWQTF